MSRGGRKCRPGPRCLPGDADNDSEGGAGAGVVLTAGVGREDVELAVGRRRGPAGVGHRGSRAADVVDLRRECATGDATWKVQVTGDITGERSEMN